MNFILGMLLMAAIDLLTVVLLRKHFINALKVLP